MAAPGPRRRRRRRRAGGPPRSGRVMAGEQSSVSVRPLSRWRRQARRRRQAFGRPAARTGAPASSASSCSGPHPTASASRAHGDHGGGVEGHRSADGLPMSPPGRRPARTCPTGPSPPRSQPAASRTSGTPAAGRRPSQPRRCARAPLQAEPAGELVGGARSGTAPRGSLRAVQAPHHPAPTNGRPPPGHVRHQDVPVQLRIAGRPCDAGTAPRRTQRRAAGESPTRRPDPSTWARRLLEPRRTKQASRSNQPTASATARSPASTTRPGPADRPMRRRPTPTSAPENVRSNPGTRPCPHPQSRHRSGSGPCPASSRPAPPADPRRRPRRPDPGRRGVADPTAGGLTLTRVVVLQPRATRAR